jgi:transcriptional regulator with XRE-family HTH domain
MTDLRQLLATNMKRYRKMLGISQMKLADQMNTSPSFIAKIEVGKKFPSPEMLERIAEALQVDTPELFSMQAMRLDFLENLHDEILDDVERIIAKRLHELAEKFSN